MHRKQIQNAVKDVVKSFPALRVSFNKDSFTVVYPISQTELRQQCHAKLAELGCARSTLIPKGQPDNHRVYNLPKQQLKQTG